MKKITVGGGLAISLALTLPLGPGVNAQDNIGHRHHEHKHNPPHPSAPDATRFITNRDGAVLPLPGEEESFFFVVFGDRTGGPAGGVSVLADAVHDTNLLEPDLVMTVGDLVNGYNARDDWLVQMREFKGIMDELLCPWFPVAGNHDVYWRGPDQPPNEHDDNFEAHFGPLWYAFEHKDCWFIVLFTDETNPTNGRKSFSDPASQTMSPEQYAWLKQTLGRTSDAKHVFVFVHHPRWLGGGYGSDWDRVHTLLAAAGNVRAVFAGHIHRMRYDGARDGIEYVTLATVGGGQSGIVPEAGYLHHIDIVTVRENQIALAAVPVGEVIDVREITGTVSLETRQLAGMLPGLCDRPRVASNGAVDSIFRTVVRNPVSRPIEVTLTAASTDSRWVFSPTHHHRIIPPDETFEFRFRVGRGPGLLDESLRPITLSTQIDYLAKGFRYSVPERTVDIPLDVDFDALPATTVDHAIALDGRSHAEVAHRMISLPDGPFTLECWFRARSFGKRTGLLCKTESSDYGFFVNGGVPEFFVFLGNSYVIVKPPDMRLTTDTWYHLAGVFDGHETRLYVNGHLVDAEKRAGQRRMNSLPLVIGADVDKHGHGISQFDGLIDGVRLSTVARYTESAFTPARRHAPDDDTVLLLNMEGTVGPWIYDESKSRAHPMLVGDARIVESPR